MRKHHAKAIRYAICELSAFLIIWLLAAFIAAEINPFNWGEFGRLHFILAIFLGQIPAIVVAELWHKAEEWWR